MRDNILGLDRALSVDAGIVPALLGALGMFAAPVMAKDRTSQQKIDTLEKRVDALAAQSPPDPLHSLSGLIEIEAGWAEDYDGQSDSDLTLSTVELGLEAELSESLSARLLLLYEEGEESELEVDEAVVSLALPGWGGTYMDLGRQYVPFGRYDTALVSDPLALELAETRETAGLLGWQGNDIYASAWVFRGETRHDVSNLGLNLGTTFVAGSMEWGLGGAYTTSLGDADALQGEVAGGKRVGGYNAYLTVGHGQFTLAAEYVTAANRFHVDQLEFAGQGARPDAWGVELTYEPKGLRRPVTLAMAAQGTNEALALELPRNRWLVGVSVEIMDQLSVSAEYSHDRDYGESSGGSGQSANAFVVQVAATF